MRQNFRDRQAWWSQLADEPAVDTPAPVPAPKMRPSRPKRTAGQVRSDLAEELYQPEADYQTFTYKASRHEQRWLPATLQGFYDDSLITDVLARVKGGKEANVYCCQANPSLGLELLAAKIYRPSLLRNLKNDALYKEGRLVLSDEGKTRLDGRSRRAIQKKTRIGSEMSITSWIEHEYQTLFRLYAAGGDVPRPVAQAGSAILMAYIGELGNPAPALSDVALGRDEAHSLFERLMWNVRLMLDHDLVHADLSAYNVLYWEGTATIIDFPQVIDPLRHRLGFDLLLRDVQRLCGYFARYGVRAEARALAGDLWTRYEQSH